MAKEDQVVVVILPFFAQGHLNQLLHLCRLISAYNIPIHYVTTTTHGHQAKRRLHGWDPLSFPTIYFHELPTPHFVAPPPDRNSLFKFPSHLLPSFEALSHLREPFKKLLLTLAPHSQRIVIIYDSLMGYVVQDFVLVPNVEAYTFHSVSAFSMFFYFWEALGRPFPIEASLIKDLPSLEGCFTQEFIDFISKQHEYIKLSSGRIYNTSKVIEKQFLDLLDKEEITGKKKQWALGPFNPVALQEKFGLKKRHKCLQWLDKKEPRSVIFVSFGTTTSFSNEQIKEIAIGLERSKQNFIWVIRDADKGDGFEGEAKILSEILPKGYDETVKGKGLLVRDWAPQLEILGHQSTIGFLSHCGWNSCLESITMGVPILTWPMHSDQPRNSMLVTKVLKIGIVVRSWEQRNETVKAKIVEKALRDLMGSKEGEAIRKRATRLGDTVRASVVIGDGSRMELDSFIDHITRCDNDPNLCYKCYLVIL